MVTRKQPRPLTPEQQLWWDAFKAYVPNLMPHDGRLTPTASAHLCKDFADAALQEFNTRFPKS